MQNELQVQIIQIYKEWSNHKIRTFISINHSNMQILLA